MSTVKYTPTFLRSALVNDPFCLGDLGPVDVLRIESEFPDLFESSSREDTPRKVAKSSVGLGLRNQKTTEKRTDVRRSPTPKAIRPASIRSVSPPPRRELLSPSRRLCTDPAAGSSGERCLPSYVYSRPPRIPVRHLNKFPLRKGPLTRTQPANPLPIRPVSTNTNGSLNAIQRSASGPGLPVQNLRSFYTPERKSDSELLKICRDFHQPQSSRSRLRNSPYRSKVVVVHSIEKPSKGPQSSPLLRTLPSTNTHSPLHMLSEIRSLARIEEQQLKRFQSKLYSRRPTKRQDEEEKGKGNKSATVALNESVGVRIPLNCASESDNDSTTLSSSSCAELSRFCPECRLLEQRKKQAQETIDTGKARKQTVTLSPERPKPERSNQEIADVSQDPSKIDQLLLAQILARKYEKAGRMQKHGNETRQKTSIHSRSQTQARQDTTTQPHDKLVEQLLQELIRAEILDCIHMEADEMLKNELVDDTDSEANFDSVVQKTSSDRDVGKAGTDTKSNAKLSVIDEESINLVTPELTPPEARYQYQHKVPAQILKPVHDYEDDEEGIEEVRTPEMTPVSRNGKLLHRKNGLNGKTINNGHDVTDCSSFSDFILSDNKMQTHGPVKQASEMEIENVSTPSKTSVPSRPVTESSVCDYASMSTPLKSASHERSSDPVEMARASKKVQTEASAKPKRSRSKPKPSLSAILSGLGISAAKSSEHFDFETTNDALSEGEFLHKSNGEVSLSSLTSPGLYVSNMNGEGDEDITDYENLSSILEVDTPFDDDVTISDGEAPVSLSTTLLLAKVDRLLNELN